MKRNLCWIVPVVLSLCTLSTGCARYKVTYENQTYTTTRGKPKHDKENGTFVFKDATGKKQIVPAHLIQSVEPY